MPKPLEPHPFAALFPELPPEELSLLVRDIKERGQQIELNPDPEKNKASGRPKGTLSEAAKCIGINEQRGIRGASDQRCEPETLF